MLFSKINSNLFSLSIISPLLDERLTAGWLILSCLAISMVLISSFQGVGGTGEDAVLPVDFNKYKLGAWMCR
jgi:ABC-type proline/glycine betaine transport system permease subunit